MDERTGATAGLRRRVPPKGSITVLTPVFNDGPRAGSKCWQPAGTVPVDRGECKLRILENFAREAQGNCLHHRGST